MNAKKLAAEIYALPHHRRKSAVSKLPEDQRGLVWMHIDRLAQVAQRESRKRVMARLNPGAKR